MNRSFLPALLLLSSCGDAPPREDPTGDVLADTLRATVVATIGVLEGDPDYQFADVASVAADDSGRIYVAEMIVSTVRVYAPDGRFLALIGGEGRGPGEFDWPADIVFGDSARLYVRDAGRITSLAPARTGGISDSVVATSPIPFYANTNSRRSRIDAVGVYLYPVDVGRDTLPDFYLPFEHGAPTSDTIRVPAYANMSRTLTSYVRTSPRGGRIVDGFAAAPFSAIPVWDVTRERTIFGGDGESYVLHETDADGDTIRTIRGPSVPRPVPADELADSLRALDERTDSLPVPLEQVVNLAPEIRDRRLPETLPAYIGVHVGADGRLWIEQWPAEGRPDERIFHLFTRQGDFLAVVVLEAPLVRDTPPWLADSMIYGVIRDPETDVERVVALRLPSRE